MILGEGVGAVAGAQQLGGDFNDGGAATCDTGRAWRAWVGMTVGRRSHIHNVGAIGPRPQSGFQSSHPH